MSTPFKLALALAAVTTALPAAAQTVRYDSLATFQGAAGGLQTITFDGLIPAGVPTTLGAQGYPMGLTVNGVTFSGVNSQLFVINPASSFQSNKGLGSGPFITAAGGAAANPLSQISIALTGGTNAFGFDLGTFGPRGEPVTVTFGGQSFTVATAAGLGVPTFVGFTSSSPVSSIFLSAGTGNLGDINLDNFRFGQAAAGAVPEPATWAMMIIGFGAVGTALRTRVRRRAAAAI